MVIHRSVCIPVDPLSHRNPVSTPEQPFGAPNLRSRCAIYNAAAQNITDIAAYYVDVRLGSYPTSLDDSRTSLTGVIKPHGLLPFT